MEERGENTTMLGGAACTSVPKWDEGVYPRVVFARVRKVLIMSGLQCMENGSVEVIEMVGVRVRRISLELRSLRGEDVERGGRRLHGAL